MGVHLIGFIFYTLAMLGVIFVAFIVYKNVVLGNNPSHSSKLKIEDMLRLSARKSLYVINYGEEKFLIAGDVDSTTFLAKLDEKNPALPRCSASDYALDGQQHPQTIQKNNEDEIQSKLYDLKARAGSKNNVMRNILAEINSKKERF